MDETLTPREFCAALAAEGISAEPDVEFYAVGGLRDERTWFLTSADGDPNYAPDEPMPDLLWVQVTSAADEGSNPLGFLDRCTHSQALDAVKRADAGDYSAFQPFEASLDAVPPRRPASAPTTPVSFPQAAAPAPQEGTARSATRAPRPASQGRSTAPPTY